MNNIIVQIINTKSIKHANTDSSFTKSVYYDNNHLNQKATKIIRSYFDTANIGYVANNVNFVERDYNTEKCILTTTPIYFHNNNKVVVNIIYYIGEVKYNKYFRKWIKKFNKSFKVLTILLSKMFNKEVEICVTEIYYPYINSEILAQYLGCNAPTNTFEHFEDFIITYPPYFITTEDLGSYICGIKIELSGRLITESVIPRVSSNSAQYGSFTGVCDYGKFVTKNDLGTFTIKV